MFLYLSDLLPEKPVRMVRWSHIEHLRSQEPIVCIALQLHVQLCIIVSLKSAMVGGFMSQRWTNATNHVFLLQSWLLNFYQHTHEYVANFHIIEILNMS